MNPYRYRQGDTYPAIEEVLFIAAKEDDLGAFQIDGQWWKVLDLTHAAEVHLHLRSTTRTIICGPVEIVDPKPDVRTNPDAVQLRYDPEPNDLTRDGDYEMEWLIIWEDGRESRVPNVRASGCHVIVDPNLDPTPEEIAAGDPEP